MRNISTEKYQELFDYFERKENPKKIIKNENESIKKEQPISKSNNYIGYINQIKELNKKVLEDDFLKLHEPLQIELESLYIGETKNEFNIREKKLKNLYNNVLIDLRKKESLAFDTEAWLVCSICLKQICPLKKENPVLTNPLVGEYCINEPYVKENLKTINDKCAFNIKVRKEGKILYDPNEKKIFEENLKEENIEFDDLFTCPSGKHIIGYMRENERYIYYGSDITIKYPDLSYEIIDDKNHLLNEFIYVHEKVKKIQEMKKTDEFKNEIFCKLCEFYVKDDLKEFKEHLEDEDHKKKMKELRNEFA